MRQHDFSGITLDIRLPDIDGRRVLDRLKDDPTTRHIPVLIVSADDTGDLGLKHGALSPVAKPIVQSRLTKAFVGLRQFIERPVKNLLLVEDNEIQRNSTIELIGNSDVHTYAVATGQEGFSPLQKTGANPRRAKAPRYPQAQTGDCGVDGLEAGMLWVSSVRSR